MLGPGALVLSFRSVTNPGLTVIQVPVLSLRAEDDERSGGEVSQDRRGRRPPHERVADEVDLTMILGPKVLRNKIQSEALPPLARAQLPHRLEPATNHFIPAPRQQ